MRRPMPSVCRHVGPKAAAAQQRWFADCRPYCTLCQAFDSEDHRSPRTHKWQMQEWQQRAASDVEGGALRASAMSLKGGEEPAALPHDRTVRRLLPPSERQKSRAAVERHDRLVPVGGIPTQRTVCVREHSTSSWSESIYAYVADDAANEREPDRKALHVTASTINAKTLKMLAIYIEQELFRHCFDVSPPDKLAVDMSGKAQRLIAQQAQLCREVRVGCVFGLLTLCCFSARAYVSNSALRSNRTAFCYFSTNICQHSLRQEVQKQMQLPMVGPVSFVRTERSVKVAELAVHKDDFVVPIGVFTIGEKPGTLTGECPVPAWLAKTVPANATPSFWIETEELTVPVPDFLADLVINQEEISS